MTYNPETGTIENKRPCWTCGQEDYWPWNDAEHGYWCPECLEARLAAGRKWEADEEAFKAYTAEHKMTFGSFEGRERVKELWVRRRDNPRPRPKGIRIPRRPEMNVKIYSRQDLNLDYSNQPDLVKVEVNGVEILNTWRDLTYLDLVKLARSLGATVEVTSDFQGEHDDWTYGSYEGWPRTEILGPEVPGTAQETSQGGETVSRPSEER